LADEVHSYTALACENPKFDRFESDASGSSFISQNSRRASIFGDVSQREGLLEGIDAENLGWADQTVLVVDDNLINRKVAQKLLESVGIRCIIMAVHGKEALDMIFASPSRFDIVFMDVSMPVMVRVL
jgi:PleD family two-component response regulator